MPGVELGHMTPKIKCLPGYIGEVSEILEKNRGLVVRPRLSRSNELVYLCPQVAFPSGERLQTLSAA